MKKILEPAASYPAIEIVATMLEVDPEIADEYLFGFAKEWGKPGLDSMMRSFEFLINNDLLITLRNLMDHDLFLKKDAGETLLCERY